MTNPYLSSKASDEDIVDVVEGQRETVFVQAPQGAIGKNVAAPSHKEGVERLKNYINKVSTQYFGHMQSEPGCTCRKGCTEMDVWAESLCL